MMIRYTINTDASYSHQYNRGAWAYWIKGDNNFHAKDSGMFRQELKSSNLAELLAFEKALQVVNQNVPKHHRGAVYLHVNTDSKFVIRMINGEINPKKYRMLFTAIRHVMSGYKINAQHVKAHTDELDEARKWVNDWCDKAAKKEMGKELY